MDTKSLLIFESPNSKLSPTAFPSPGNRPFGDLWKKTIDAVSMSEQVNRRSSIRLSADFSNSGRKSLSFCDLNASDFGRESLGILPPDFGRDSLGFMNINRLETDRESLGIIQIRTLRESFDFRRESLGILNLKDLGRESLDSGRESLGILHLKSPDIKFEDEGKRIPDIMLTTIEENSGEPSNILNIAFLQPHSRKSSTLSNSSSMNPSFNSLSLEGPSRISLSSMRNFKDSVDSTLNLTYSNSSAPSSIHSPLNKGKIFSPSELNFRSRIQSVPGYLQGQFSPLYGTKEFRDTTDRRFWSADRTSCFNIMEKISFREALDFKEADVSNEFHDSVFIEGHILAEKIADGSILNETSVGEAGVLDSTPQPDWPNDLSYNDNKNNDCPKCDTETIFKTVDKMLPPSNKDILNTKLRTSKTDSNSSEENENRHSPTDEQNVSKLLHNLSDIQHEPKKHSAKKKGPKEILENLSELLNCSNPSDKQKSEGKNLLNSLADILGDSKSSTKNNDDSGHSSINEQSDSPNKENHEFFEVLDLRVKSTDTSKEKSCTKSDVLDLSLKSKPIENLVKKRLTQSCSSSPNIKPESHTEKKNVSASSLDMSRNKTSNSSVASNDSKNMSNVVKLQISGKLRQKHHSSNLKKGPMKAVIPLGDMKKKGNTSGTPEKNEHMTSMMQSKRTSTPINEPKLKPMAASTPTAKETPRSYKNPRSSSPAATKKSVNAPSAGTKKSVNASPVETRKSVNASAAETKKSVNASSAETKKSVNTSAAGTNKSDSSTTFTRDRAYSSTCLPRSSVTGTVSKLRRNSVSDVKKPTETLRRRNSVETESGIMSSVARARQNVGSSYQYRKQTYGVENVHGSENRGKLAENRHLPVSRSSNLELKSNANKKITPDKQKQNVSTTEPSSIPSPQQRKCKTPSSPSQEKTKMGLRRERSSISVVGRNTESKAKVTRRNSIGNMSGVLSSLPKIRQNMLESPYFPLMKEDPLNKNYILSENRGLGRATAPQFPQLKKTGKENTEK